MIDLTGEEEEIAPQVCPGKTVTDDDDELLDLLDEALSLSSLSTHPKSVKVSPNCHGKKRKRTDPERPASIKQRRITKAPTNIILLDLDHTLVLSSEIRPKDWLSDQNRVCFKHSRGRRYVQLRPYTHKLLLSLHENGFEIGVVSAGDQEVCNSILERLINTISIVHKSLTFSTKSLSSI